MCVCVCGILNLSIVVSYTLLKDTLELLLIDH